MERKKNIYRLSKDLLLSTLSKIYICNVSGWVTIGFGFRSFEFTRAEREREQIRSGIKKVSINGEGMIDNLSRDNVRVVAYAARRVSANLSSL